MTDQELDEVYTALCRALGELGHEQALMLLSRFALLAMLEIDSPDRLHELIGQAAEPA